MTHSCSKQTYALHLDTWIEYKTWPCHICWKPRKPDHPDPEFPRSNMWLYVNPHMPPRRALKSSITTTHPVLVSFSCCFYNILIILGEFYTVHFNHIYSSLLPLTPPLSASSFISPLNIMFRAFFCKHPPSPIWSVHILMGVRSPA